MSVLVQLQGEQVVVAACASSKIIALYAAASTLVYRKQQQSNEELYKRFSKAAAQLKKVYKLPVPRQRQVYILSPACICCRHYTGVFACSAASSRISFADMCPSTLGAVGRSCMPSRETPDSF
jgi:hypothetical protein